MGDVRKMRLASGAIGVALALLIPSVVLAQQPLQKVRYTFANSVVSPTQINIVLPEILGYYRQEGLTLEPVPFNSDSGGYAMLDTGRVEFAGGGPPSQFALHAKGASRSIINIMEHTYPFKYGLAVNPSSPIQNLQDLKGKRIGVTGFGGTEYAVGRAVLRLIGLDPDKDVSWLAVGNNAVAGEALRRGNIDALYYYDTGFGTIEAAGIPIRYVPHPPNIPKVGGIYVVTSRKLLKEHRPWALGVMRGMLKAENFIQANPEAAAYEFIQMFPEAAPKGKSLEEQVKAVLNPVSKRAPLYSNYDASAPQGQMSAKEWQDEIVFAGLQDKIKDPSEFYTNELVAEANQFDKAKVREHAQNFPLPYKKK
jgi:NitT/TauT family transport system substrate-binding protein